MTTTTTNTNNNSFWKDYTEEEKTAYTAYLVTKVKSLLFELEDEDFRKEAVGDVW